MEDVQRKFQKKYMIITFIVCILLAVVGGYFIVKEVISNNKEATETNKENIVLELGSFAYLSQYIENIDEVENAVFEKTDVLSIDAEYAITPLAEGNDSLVVTYKDGTNEVLTFEVIEVKDVTIGLGEKVYLGDYVDNVDNIKSATFINSESFSIQDNYVTANHSGIEHLEITYKDGKTDIIKFICNAQAIELEVGQSVNLSDYVEDITIVSSVTVNDPSVFTIENNIVTALSEGSTILTVTYTDGITELIDLTCQTKTSNASVIKKIEVLKNNGGSEGEKLSRYYIYAIETKIENNFGNTYHYKYYSDASLTKRIYQLDLGYITYKERCEQGMYQELMLYRSDSKTVLDNGIIHYRTVTKYNGELITSFDKALIDVDRWSADGDFTGCKIRLSPYDPEIHERVFGFWYKITLNDGYSQIKKVLMYSSDPDPFSENYQFKVIDANHFNNWRNNITDSRYEVEKISVPTNNSGLVFGGYYTEKNGKGTQVIDSKGNILPLGLKELYKNPSNVVLYAKWTRPGASNRVPTSSYRGY